jgi:hypothetical protein
VAFAPFVSPARLVQREILTYAVAEAVAYGTTAREVIETFFAGKPRPGLLAQLDRLQAAAGVPPHEAMELVNRFFDPEEIEPIDLEILVHGYADQMPTPPQAKEIEEAAQRLRKRARIHSTRVKAAQAIHDAQVAETQTIPPEPRWSSLHRTIRARSVQRYRGLET